MAKMFTITVPPDLSRKKRERTADPRYVDGQKMLVKAMNYLAKADPIILTGAKKQNGTFQAGFTNLQGGTFSVWAATNISLSLSNWTNLGAVTDSPPGQFQFTDPQGSNYPQRFYRVSSP